jgi:hypothetical protein
VGVGGTGFLPGPEPLSLQATSESELKRVVIPRALRSRECMGK